MPSSKFARTPTQPDAIEQRTKLYSMAAAAAGVSLLALSQPADAKVVITTHINIPITGSVFIDLNHDGISDVKFTTGGYHPIGAMSTYLEVQGLNGGGVVGTATNGASELLRSAKIGASAAFLSSGGMAQRFCTAYSPCELRGNWGGGQPNRFLGVKFLIDGATHYGWIRVTVKNPTNQSAPFSGTITEYGYETIPNKRVLAGLPSKTDDATATEEIGKFGGGSLGMLALGANGLALWRRDDSASAVN